MIENLFDNFEYYLIKFLNICFPKKIKEKKKTLQITQINKISYTKEFMYNFNFKEIMFLQFFRKKRNNFRNVIKIIMETCHDKKLIFINFAVTKEFLLI